MKMLPLLITFILIECSVGAPPLDCASELDGYKELVKAKAALKSSLVEALLEQVNKIDIQTKDGDTLLMLAARNGLTDVVNQLLNLSATISISKDAITAASEQANEAGFQGVVGILRKSLESDGNNMNKKDKIGNTALLRAAEAGDLDKVELLIELHNADVNIQGQYGTSPLHWAAGKGHTEMVDFLLNITGIDVNLKDIDGWTPLHNAVFAGKTDIVQILLNTSGILVNEADVTGNTPLHTATREGHTEIVGLLLNTTGIDVNAMFIYGRTPLHIAASEGNTDIVKLLVKTTGIEVNTEDQSGKTPLYWTSHDDIIKILKEAGGV